MHRSYVDEIVVNAVGQEVNLSLDESKHVSKVLRIREGEKIELCDSVGNAYLAEVVSAMNPVTVRIIEEMDNNEPDKKVVLFQSLSKGTKRNRSRYSLWIESSVCHRTHRTNHCVHG